MVSRSPRSLTTTTQRARDPSATQTSPIAARVAVVGGRSYPVVLPSIRDPRLHVAAVIISLHVLGQTALDFELLIAQILVSLGTSAVIEFVIVFATRRALVWPASALLTGNGVAFLLRVEGTEHGQWWSLRGAHIFAATAAVGVLSKYLVRARGRPLFNPSNIALVLCFIVLGTDRVNPLDFWWGPRSAAMVAVYVIIVAGGLIITAACTCCLPLSRSGSRSRRARESWRSGVTASPRAGTSGRCATVLSGARSSPRPRC